MTLFKMALLNFKKRAAMNILIILEMTAAIIVFSVMISSILIRYTYYEPLKDIFESNGYFALLNLENENKEKNNWIHGAELGEYIGNPQKIISISEVSIYKESSNGRESFLHSVGRAYSDEAIKRFPPKLKDGRWLNTSDRADVIETVISENPFGWKVGDKLQLCFFGDHEGIFHTVEIVGEIENGTKIFGLNALLDKEHDFNLCYSVYDYEYEEVPLMLFSSEYLDNVEIPVDVDPPAEITQRPLGVHLIVYDNDTSEDVLNKGQKMLGEMAEIGSAHTISFGILEPNSRKYLYMQVYNLLPIIIAILILTFVSSVSSTAISTRERLRDYSVFYITGLRWNQCILINLIQSAVISLLSLILAFAGMAVIPSTPLSSTVTIIWNGWIFLAATGIILIYMLVSMLMPAIIIRGSTPKEILTR